MTDHLDHTQIRLLVDRLDQITQWVHQELENAITCQVAFTDKTLARVTSDGETPLAFNERASDCAHQLLGTLRSWTNHVATERGLPWPGDGRAPHFARWLSRHVYDLARVENAANALTEILDAYETALRTIDRPPTKQRTIDENQLDEARALELNARACVQIAKTLGPRYSGLTQRKIKYLTETGALKPLRIVKGADGGRYRIYNLGSVLDLAARHGGERIEA